jgi:hypothetical protein
VNRSYNLGQLRGAFSAGVRKAEEESAVRNTTGLQKMYLLTFTDKAFQYSGEILSDCEDSITIQTLGYADHDDLTVKVLAKPLSDNAKVFRTWQEMLHHIDFHAITNSRVRTGEWCRDFSTGSVFGRVEGYNT